MGTRSARWFLLHFQHRARNLVHGAFSAIYASQRVPAQWAILTYQHVALLTGNVSHMETLPRCHIIFSCFRRCCRLADMLDLKREKWIKMHRSQRDFGLPAV